MAKTPEQKLEVIRDRAFSKILWGERDTEVYRFLRNEGLKDDVIETIMDDAFRERAATIRKRSIRNMIFGAIGSVVLGGVLFWILVYSPVIPIYGVGLAIVGLCTCLAFFFKSLVSLFSGKTQGSALMD